MKSTCTNRTHIVDLKTCNTQNSNITLLVLIHTKVHTQTSLFMVYQMMDDGNSHSFEDKTEQDLCPRNNCQSTHKRQQQFPLAFSLIGSRYKTNNNLETKHRRIQSQIPPSKSRSEIWCSYCIVRTTKFEDSLSSSKAKHNGMMEGYCK